MIVKDQHIHTHYSKDADPKATWISYIEHANKIGLQSLTFTEHHDIDPAHPLFKEPIDFKAYIKAFNEVKKQTGFQMILGVEIGYQHHVKEEIQQFIRSFPFEHIILSVHYIEKKDLYTGEFFKGKTKEEAYEIYFKTCLDAIESIDDFHTFGHLDYIPRYAPYGDYDYDTHQDIIDKILTALIKKNKALEINTSGFVTEGRVYPRIEVIQRYIELGGKHFTVGSDAHRVDELGRFFDQIPNIVDSYVKG